MSRNHFIAVIEFKEIPLGMIAESGISIIMKTFIIEMAFEIAMLALEREEALDRFDVSEILICRGNDTPIRTAFHRCFDILEQQDKTSLFDKADRKGECLATAQVVLYFIEKCDLGVVG